ncbi:hypothetical protein Bca52824_063732 [Brassica carinata]|uniref:Leucine-rich repeat-containing N-terminal plant-type domain-containing protein n=1 Tax=Brassica carinata TaxID=52824 RepID=A0A8X7U7Z8_BRACI|nr:hypothetical protein Bca52824_063732 [Brassica carinata]
MGLLHHYWWVMILLVVIELRFYSSNSQNLTCHPRELEALRDFINEVDSKPDGWDFNSTGDCCEWEGMHMLFFASLKRSGQEDTENHQAEDCPVILNLSRNFIFGSIPGSIFNLANLETLDLSSKRLNLPLLINLTFASNKLNGSLPVHICQNSTEVRLIRLESNSFSGDIPYGFEKCAELTGNIPEDLFFQLQRLNLLEIQEKGLSGSLGPALGNLSSLVHLDISSNRFSGEIPDVFDTLHELEYLMAKSNRFSGGIPKSLANSQSLILHNLGNNSLSGPLYLNCAVMTNLASLDLGTNKFNSSFPESFKDFIDASHPSALQEPDNSDSHFEFPWRDMLPDDPRLHFKMLKVLVVANSRLTGSMPRWLSRSTNLELLDLSWNSLTGAIPDWTGGFDNLFYLDLSRNSLTGEIPKRWRSLISADEPSLQYKHFFGLPPTLQLSQNNLSGPIWEDFGKLKKLHVANLNGNRLSGTIPSSLSEMTSLEVLDLSNNRFSGSIPESLLKLTFLSMFSVANSSLSGRIPSGGQFQTFPDSSYEGNDFFLLQLDSMSSRFTPDERRPSTSETDYSDSDIALDLLNGVARGFTLSFVVVVTFLRF